MTQYFEIEKKIPLHQYILEKCPFNKNVAILDYFSNEKLCYHQLASKIFYFGKNLQKILNFKPLDRVCIILKPYFSLPLHLVVNLGITCVGGTHSFIDPLSELASLNKQIKKTKATSLIIHSIYLRESLLDSTSVKNLIIIGEVDKSKWPNQVIYKLESFLGKPPNNDIKNIKVCFDIENDILCLPFNARQSRCVKFNHLSIIRNLIQLEQFGEINKNEIILINYPYFHLFTFVFTFYGLIQNAKIITLSKFTVQSFLKCITKYNVTKCFLHVTSILHLYENFDSKILNNGNYNISSLKSILCLGPRISRVIQKDLCSRLKVDVKNCYGYVETLFLSLQRDDDVQYNKSYNPVGKLLPSTNCRIIDKNAKLVSKGKIGDIAISGPQCGHYYEEKEYKWYKTGDVGTIDNKRNLIVVDQIINKIKVQSNTFYTNELKDLLITHDEIVDAIVLNDSGLVKGYVVKKGNSELQAKDLIEYIVNSLNREEQYKIINQIQFVDKIPRDTSGYLKANLLREKREIVSL